MRYKYTGNLTFNAEDSKNPSIRCGATKKDGTPYMTVGFRVNNDHNGAWVESFALDSDVIKTYDTDGNSIEIDRDNASDPDVISTVASFKRHVISIDGDRKEFISDYLFNTYIEEHMDELNGGMFTVTGQSSKNFYNGKASDRFQIQNIYSASEDAKPSLKVNMVFYFSKDSVDTADFATDKKIIFNGYTSEYINKNDLGTTKGENKYVSQQIILDASKLDFNNEKHIKLLKFKLKQMGLDYVDGKIKNNLKGKNYYSMAVVCSYVNGAELLPFDESMLTDNQREAIELGFKTVDDFRPSGNIYGNRIVAYKLVDFDLKEVNKIDYSEGYVDTDMSISEFEENIFTPVPAEESLDDVLKGAMNEPTSSDDSDDDDDTDLFE